MATCSTTMTTPYHSKYLAHELTKRVSAADNAEKLSQSLCNATVDLNPHQVEAALLRVPLSRLARSGARGRGWSRQDHR